MTFAGLVLAVFVLAVGTGLGEAPITRSTELRCFEVARHMVESRDVVVPMRDGSPWINKPPLGYWAIVTAATLRGRLDLVALRLPSFVAALVLLVITGAWARGAGGARHALVAMALLGMTVKLQGLARTGSAEVLLAMSTTLALAAYGTRSLPAVWRRGAFGIGFALAMLAKASMAWLVVALPIGVDLLVAGRLRSVLAPRNLALVALAVAPAAAWYGAVCARVPGAFDELIGAATLPLGIRTEAARGAHWATHYGAPHEPLLDLVSVALPVSLLFPLLVRRGVQSRLWRGRPELRFAAIVSGTVLVALMLLPQKRPHYLLPVVPALSLLVADAALAFAQERDRSATVLRWIVVGLVGAIGLVGTAAVAFWTGPVVGRSVLAWCGVIPVGALVTACCVVAALRRADHVFGCACVLGWALLMATHWGSVDLWRRAHRAGTAFQLEDFDPRRWAVTTERYPELLRGFVRDEKWAVRHISSADLEARGAR